MNDVIIGTAVTTFLFENRAFLASMLYKVYMVSEVECSPRNIIPILALQESTVIGLNNILTWLDNWPAGLKLNTELSHFLFLLFTGLVKAWECKEYNL